MAKMGAAFVAGAVLGAVAAFCWAATLLWDVNWMWARAFLANGRRDNGGN